MILSIAITTKTGRALVSRQFNRMPRSVVEGHLNAFPKLLTGISQSYIETESIRYVFQDIGDLYFILITTKDSNILEDLDLLNMLIELTRDVLRDNFNEKATESAVVNSALELIFAFDECVFDGYRQTVTVDEVNNFLLMESKEEDEARRIQQLQEQEAKRERDLKIKEIEKQKKLLQQKQQQQQQQSFGFDGYPAEVAQEIENREPTIVMEEIAEVKKPRRVGGTGGMVLGKKISPRERARQMIREEGLAPQNE